MDGRWSECTDGRYINRVRSGSGEDNDRGGEKERCGQWWCSLSARRLARRGRARYPIPDPAPAIFGHLSHNTWLS